MSQSRTEPTVFWFNACFIAMRTVLRGYDILSELIINNATLMPLCISVSLVHAVQFSNDVGIVGDLGLPTTTKFPHPLSKNNLSFLVQRFTS
jgi:hypothetical protein